MIYRPKASQNIVMRLSGAVMCPGAGLRDLFAATDRSKHYYSILANVILTY